MGPLQFGLPGGPELVILGLDFLILPFVMAYWVYTDAERRGTTTRRCGRWPSACSRS